MTEPIPCWAFAVFPEDVRTYQSPSALVMERTSFQQGWVIYPYDDSLIEVVEEISGHDRLFYSDLVAILNKHHFHIKTVVWT